MKTRLNKRAVDGAVYQGRGACYLWDTATASFGLRIYPSGRKSFVVTYRPQQSVSLRGSGDRTFISSSAAWSVWRQVLPILPSPTVYTDPRSYLSRSETSPNATS